MSLCNHELSILCCRYRHWCHLWTLLNKNECTHSLSKNKYRFRTKLHTTWLHRINSARKINSSQAATLCYLIFRNTHFAVTALKEALVNPRDFSHSGNDTEGTCNHATPSYSQHQLIQPLVIQPTRLIRTFFLTPCVKTHPKFVTPPNLTELRVFLVVIFWL